MGLEVAPQIPIDVTSFSTTSSDSSGEEIKKVFLLTSLQASNNVLTVGTVLPAYKNNEVKFCPKFPDLAVPVMKPDRKCCDRLSIHDPDPSPALSCNFSGPCWNLAYSMGIHRGLGKQ